MRFLSNIFKRRPVPVPAAVQEQTPAPSPTDIITDIFNRYPSFFEQEDLIYFPEIQAYGAFKYEVVKDILKNRESIGVSTVHLALNNIYFSEDEKVHQQHKRSAINHLTFLSSKLQYADNAYTQHIFRILASHFPQGMPFDLVDYLVNPIILINVLKEYGFLDVFPEFDPESPAFDFDSVTDRIRTFFQDTDQLESMLRDYLEQGGMIPEKMKLLLDEISDADTDPADLPRYFRSMIFSAVESTTGFLSTMIYLVFTQYPSLLNDLRSNGNELHMIAEESLRIYTPVPFIYRTVREDIRYAGKDLKKGEMVILFIGAANMDPSVFEAPHEIRQRTSKHLSFGRGQFACIGQFASFRITMHVLGYLAEYAQKLEFTERDARHTIHNSMLKLPLNVIFRG